MRQPRHAAAALWAPPPPLTFVDRCAPAADNLSSLKKHFLAVNVAPRRHRQFFGTGGVPPPTKLTSAPLPSADTMTSAHSSSHRAHPSYRQLRALDGLAQGLYMKWLEVESNQRPSAPKSPTTTTRPTSSLHHPLWLFRLHLLVI